MDRIVSITDPAGGVKYFEYDTLDRVTKKTDENGVLAKLWMPVRWGRRIRPGATVAFASRTVLCISRIELIY
jgi:hypothetical protein